MKKLSIVILLAHMFIPILSIGQTYISGAQLDIPLSGNKKINYDNATLNFSKERGEFSIKFDKLNTPITFKITFKNKKDNGDHIQSMYTIIEDLNYGGLKIAEYKSPIEVGDSSYPLSFTIIGMGSNDRVYYTTFYSKEKIDIIKGKPGGFARYIKTVDENEKTNSFVQEIYNATDQLTEIHEKYPLDTGHKKLKK